MASHGAARTDCELRCLERILSFPSAAGAGPTVVPRDASLQKSCPPAPMESLESGAREKRWNTARRHAGLCSFSFSGRMTGHRQNKREKREKREKETPSVYRMGRGGTSWPIGGVSASPLHHTHSLLFH